MFEVVTIHKPEANAVELEGEITKLLTKEGGKVVEVAPMGERRLSFHLKGYPAGVYTVYHAELPEDKVAEISRQLRFIEDLLRTRIYKKA